MCACIVKERKLISDRSHNNTLLAAQQGNIKTECHVYSILEKIDREYFIENVITIIKHILICKKDEFFKVRSFHCMKMVVN